MTHCACPRVSFLVIITESSAASRKPLDLSIRVRESVMILVILNLGLNIEPGIINDYSAIMIFGNKLNPGFQMRKVSFRKPEYYTT